MSPEFWVGIAGFTTVITGGLWGGGTIYGSLITVVKGHTKTIGEHGDLLMGEGKRLADHDIHLARLDTWKEGLATGATLAAASGTAAAAVVAEDVLEAARVVADARVKAAKLVKRRAGK